MASREGLQEEESCRPGTRHSPPQGPPLLWAQGASAKSQGLCDHGCRLGQSTSLREAEKLRLSPRPLPTDQVPPASERAALLASRGDALVFFQQRREDYVQTSRGLWVLPPTGCRPSGRGLHPATSVFPRFKIRGTTVCPPWSTCGGEGR